MRGGWSGEGWGVGEERVARCGCRSLPRTDLNSIFDSRRAAAVS